MSKGAKLKAEHLSRVNFRYGIILTALGLGIASSGLTALSTKHNVEAAGAGSKENVYPITGGSSA